MKTKHLAKAVRLLGILALATGSLAGLSIPGAAALVRAVRRTAAKACRVLPAGLKRCAAAWVVAG